MFLKDYCLYRNGAEQTQFIVYTRGTMKTLYLICSIYNPQKVLQRSFYARVFLSLFWINKLHSV